MKEQLATSCMLGPGNQFRTKDASALAVFLADLQLKDRISRIEHLERDATMRDPNYLNVMPIAASFLTGEGHAATFLKQIATDAMSTIQPMPTIEPVQAWSFKNASLVAQTYVLAATSHWAMSTVPRLSWMMTCCKLGNASLSSCTTVMRSKSRPP